MQVRRWATWIQVKGTALVALTASMSQSGSWVKNASAPGARVVMSLAIAM
jgi:hypothetical protein